MYTFNRTIVTQSFNVPPQRHASCFNAEGQILQYPTAAPQKTIARKRVLFVCLAVSLMIGLGHSFQSSRVQRPLPFARPAHDTRISTGHLAAFDGPKSHIAEPYNAGYQWVGFHRLSPLAWLPMELR